MTSKSFSSLMHLISEALSIAHVVMTSVSDLSDFPYVQSPQASDGFVCLVLY